MTSFVDSLHTHTHTHIHTRAHSHRHAHTWTHAYTYIHYTLMHTRMHTHTTTHTHTQYTHTHTRSQRHHFTQTLCILNSDGCNIFEKLSPVVNSISLNQPSPSPSLYTQHPLNPRLPPSPWDH